MNDDSTRRRRRRRPFQPDAGEEREQAPLFAGETSGDEASDTASADDEAREGQAGEGAAELPGPGVSGAGVAPRPETEAGETPAAAAGIQPSEEAGAERAGEEEPSDAEIRGTREAGPGGGEERPVGVRASALEEPVPEPATAEDVPPESGLWPVHDTPAAAEGSAAHARGAAGGQGDADVRHGEEAPEPPAADRTTAEPDTPAAAREEEPQPGLGGPGRVEPAGAPESVSAGSGGPGAPGAGDTPEEPWPRRRARPAEGVQPPAGAVARREEGLPPGREARPLPAELRGRRGRREARPGGRRPGEGAGFAAVVIERDDDLATILGKLDTANSPHVAMVTHGGNREMERNRLTLRRIRRHAEQTGKDAVVVTRRWGLRAKARREGLRTAYMTRGIRWGRRRGRIPSVSAIPLVGGLARLIVGAAVILGGLVAAYLLIPSATIVVRPSIQPIAKAIDVTVSSAHEVADYEFGEVPAQRFKMSLPFSVSVPVTGTKQVPTGKATGIVEFENPRDEEITIPEGTRIKTSKAVVFLTDEEITVGPGATKQVGVTSLTSGDASAVEAGEIKILEGDLFGRVQVTNPEPTDPGGTETVPAVSDADLANLRTVVIDAIYDRALEELRGENPGALVFADTLHVSIVEEEFSHDLGEVANWLIIDAETSITALGASRADLEGLARFWLAEELFEDEVILDSTLNAEIAPDTVVEFDEEEQTVTATLLLQAGVVPYFDPREIQDAIAGTGTEDARYYLAQQFNSLLVPVVERGPEWLPGGLPRLDWRIKLVVEPGP